MIITAIAKNTFLEAIRSKILAIIAFFGVVMIGSSLLLSELSIRQGDKIINEVGLASIAIFGTIIAIFTGSNMLFKEIDKRTIFHILSKPIRRSSFILGKFFGLSAVIVLIAMLMTLLFAGLMALQSFTFTGLHFLAISASIVEMILMIGVVLFFSSFASPILTTFFSIGVFLIGHSTATIKAFVEKQGLTHLEPLTNALYYIFPNLELLNFRVQAVHQITVDWSFVASSFLYAALYITFLLIATILIFQKKEF